MKVIFFADGELVSVPNFPDCPPRVGEQVDIGSMIMLNENLRKKMTAKVWGVRHVSWKKEGDFVATCTMEVIAGS